MFSGSVRIRPYGDDIARVAIPVREIASRVASLADEITLCYADNRGGITIVTVLMGPSVFLADLIRLLRLRVSVAPLAASYLGKTTESRGTRPESAILPDLCNSEVLIVDDILNTSGMLHTVRVLVLAGASRNVRTAMLVRKRARTPPTLPVESVGFDIEDAFVVGYGLDYNAWC